MDESTGIGPLNPTRFEVGGDSGGAAGRGADGASEDPPAPRPGDEVKLMPPREAMLGLLRQRVLAATRERLELAAVPARGADLPHPGPQPIEAFVGHLLSAQNLLAASRRGEWSEGRVGDALRDAMASGLEETLTILEELGSLDEQAYELVGTISAEMERKLHVGDLEEN